jgi:hypothetical protein
LGALGGGEAGDECQQDDGKTFLHRLVGDVVPIYCPIKKMVLVDHSLMK